MKVQISVGGRFHAFNLAEQLNKGGFLYKLITSYPQFVVKKFINLSKNQIVSLPIKEFLERGWSKLPKYLTRLWNIQFLTAEVFDFQASKKIKKADIFIGW